MSDKPKFVQLTTLSCNTGRLTHSVVIALNKISTIGSLEKMRIETGEKVIGFYVEYLGDAMGSSISAPLEYSQWLGQQRQFLLDQLEITVAPEAYENKDWRDEE